MDDSLRHKGQSTALVTHSRLPKPWACDLILAKNLSRLAAASGYPSPQIIPGAAVRLINVPLPLKTTRHRRAALPFAIEASLAASIENSHAVLGPQMKEGQYLCAVVSQEFLVEASKGANSGGAVLPDILGVPAPHDPEAWSLWCGPNAAYLRFSDGGGLTLMPDVLPDLWRAQGQPELHLWHGTPPVGLRIARRITDPPMLDPDIFALDLRPASHRLNHKEWRALGRFSALAAALTCCVHLGLLNLDAAALARVAQDRSATAQSQLSARGVAPAELNQPVEFLLASLSQSLQPQKKRDPLLFLLSQAAGSLAKESTLEIRDLRFDGASKSMTVLITASTLDALQTAETKLRADGLSVISGAATRTEAGAEMELVLSEGG
ncbi:MAG: type II secretion system protein GspL [Pseudomonadota bacterium]